MEIKDRVLVAEDDKRIAKATLSRPCWEANTITM